MRQEIDFSDVEILIDGKPVDASSVGFGEGSVSVGNVVFHMIPGEQPTRRVGPRFISPVAVRRM